ncbi:mucin-6-like [Homarus americanus]|uniref:mucin-6-like n=1 Tax=Homarus americanus TaxID=6706 RepID=UPI001C4740AF|nr:mucin-6-like [Homarus americanus]
MTLEWTEGLFKDYVPGSLINSAKFQVFFQILEGCVRVGDRILLFSQSLFTLTLLEEFLQRSYIPGTYEGWLRNRSYFRLDGSTSAQEREKLINEFNMNPNIRLFLVSTRAGSLGINLVGANRVVVFDASFNPCHDTQAVCRVYRYGQKKECHIYRLVTDNSLEKRIYDRQVNKQGIADRIVDEMNPDAHLSSKEISNLLVENESDPDPIDMTDKAEKYRDQILHEVVLKHGSLFTKPPFRHESLLVDRKDKKLSRAEKRLAKRSYELEKQANISYSRPSYAAFYPKTQSGQQVIMGTKIGGVVYAKPVGTVRPLQAEMGQRLEGGNIIHRPNILSRGAQPNFPVEALAKQGVSVQQITVPKEVSIPTNSGDGKPILLKAGQSVMVIKTQKGIYLRLNDGKIVAIRVPPGNEEVFGLPLNKGSVTIVPTIVNSPRPRMQHMGRGGARRGRPPMAMQYATGNIITKGQMPVRITKKPMTNIRGGKAYQTIAMPVSGGSATPQALLNKSVVITPATKATALATSKAVRNIKLNPKLTVTTTPKGNNAGPSTSGVAATKMTAVPKITKKTTLAQLANLHRNEKLKKLNQAKKEQEKDSGSSTVDNCKSESGEEADGPVNLVSKKEEADSPKKEEGESCEAVGGGSDSGAAGLGKEHHGLGGSNHLSDSAASEASKMADNSSPLPGKRDDKLGTADASTGLVTSDGGPTTDSSSPSLHSNEVVLGAPSKSAVGFGMRDLAKPLSSSVSNSESRTGIVKPQVQQTPNKPTASLTPLQSMSNLLPPGGPGPPGAPHTISSASLGSNVAQVAPHVHQSGLSTSNTYAGSQSPFLPSTTQAQFSGNGGSYGTMSSMSSPMPATTQQATTTYPTMSDSPQLSQQQHQIQQSQQSSLSSTLAHAGSGLVHSSRSGGLGGADSPLNLSHLLNSQVFDAVPEDLSSPHSHASALDYLNYTLSTGTSAFRRPDYQATLSPDLQSLINSATSQQSLTSSLPGAAHAASNPAVTSPSPFPSYQPPTYPQYAPSYRTGTSVSASPYAAYAGQYPPYAAQYPPGLAPHAATTAQPPTMGQYGALHTPPNPYQTYPAPPTPGRSPYSSTLGGFSHGPYPPM